MAPVSVAVAAGPDYSRVWSPGTALPKTPSVKGHKAAAVPAAKPAHPVPPVWQPPKTVHPIPSGQASVQLGSAPAPQAASGATPAVGGETAASGLPVTLAPVAGSSAAGQSVQVDVADPKSTAKAGISGLAVTLTRSGQGDPGAVQVGIDASSLDGAFGANWAERAHLVQLPACAVTDPQAVGCQKQTPLASHYDPASKKITADVTLPAANTGMAQPRSMAMNSMADSAAGAAPPSTTVGVVSGFSSGTGTYAATSLNPSQAWTSGDSAGSFTYSYPVQAPPALGGAAPTVQLSYDSASVDGLTSSTNSQASWIGGDGWNYSPGFVERSYQPCSKDGIASSGDECWAGANLTLSLGGHSGQLVPNDSSCQANAPAATEQSNCTWRIKGDDGTKVQFLTGATNGTWNGSYIKVTDTSGEVYYFGLNHLPDANGNPTTLGADSGSAWTVPVYSPNSGDPCYDPAKGQASWCQSAWRWNLDYVVDPHGNLTNYTYTPEANFYARGGGQNNGSGSNSSYTRAGVLYSIGYGQLLSDQLNNNGAYQPAAKIVFNSTERCVTSTAACDPSQRTSANAVNWPDVPLDQQCAQSDNCTIDSPTFWTTKWLASIATQVKINGSYQPVDSYTLNHVFINVQNATENTMLPWLASIQRTGQDAQAPGISIPLPQVSFTSELLPNRVDGTVYPAPPAYNRPRIQLITTETGATIGVNYSSAGATGSTNQPVCSRVNNVMPASADSDTMSCYNVKWNPPGSLASATPVDDWFQRYPVASVTVNPGTPGSAPMTTTYSYGKAAWHRNDSPLTPDNARTWDQFRGYASVTAVSGSGSDGPQSQKTTTYYQGMDGDLTNGGTRSVSVAGPMSGPVTDSDWLSGQVLESDTYTQANGSITGYTVNTSSGPVITATHSQGSLPALIARYAATTTVSTTKALKTDGTWRSTSTTTTTDPAYGNRTITSLNSADGLPDICTRTNYAAGSDPQVSALPDETITVNGANACAAATAATAATVTAANTTAWKRITYDNQPFGQLGTAHDATSTLTADHFDTSGNPQFTVANATYDSYGRTTSTTDPNATDSAHPNGATVTTTYSAAAAGELPNSMTVTTPAPAGASDAATGRATTTTYDPERALPLTVTDPNGRVTTEAYDQLGRVTGVWLPGRATNLSASKTFAYTVLGVVNNAFVPPTITSSTLRADEKYNVSIEIMDGEGRSIQTQSTPAISAYSGRLITDTAYDSQGRVIRANNSWYNNDTPPSTTLYQTTTQQVPNQTYTVYDGLGRPLTQQFVAYGVVQNTTTTAYPGADRTDVTPPAGSTPTSTVTDARGHTAQLWQYRTPTATGNPGDADVTSYTYTADGQQATQKDAAGNTWTHSYDLKDREVSSVDPDTGSTTTTYDQDGRLATTTDARSQTIAYTYDLLGRKTGSYQGSVSPANQLTGFTYDTVATGQPSTSTRYVNGASGTTYTTSVLSYDTAYHPTKTTTTIPGTDIGQGSTPFTYTYQARYDPITGALTADNRSAVGDIPAETVNYIYEVNGELSTFGAFGGATYDMSSDWDAYGHPIRATVNPWGTQIVVTNTYDESTGRPLQQFVDKQTAATGSVQQTTYAYNASGQVTGVRNIPDNTPTATDLQCFGYDYLGRLTTAWSDTGTLTQAAQPSVGGQGSCTNSSPTSGAQAPLRTTVGGPAPYWQSYGYDLTGNRTQLVQHDPSGNTANDTTVAQTFPTPGTLNTPTTAQNTGGGTGGPHALLGSTTTAPSGTSSASMQYDAVGNTTSITDPTGTANLTWDGEDKLTSYNKTGTAGPTTYTYDASGNQLVRRDPGMTTVTLGNDELVYNSNAKTVTGVRYYSIPGGVTLVRQGGNMTYQIADAHGTNTLALDGTTLTETRRPTDPFGNPSGTQPSTWAGDKGFVDGTQDQSTGLTNLGAREYDPVHGRFLNPDPLFDTGNPQQWNGYAYSNNDPINLSDPSGLMFHMEPGRELCGPMCVMQEINDLHEAPQGKGGGLLDVVIGTLSAVASGVDPTGQLHKPIDWIGKQLGAHKDTDGYHSGGWIGATASWLIPGDELEKGGAKAGGLALKLLRDEERAGDAAKAAGGARDLGGSCSVLSTHSFVAGTKVLMADGSSKNIQDVAPGDRIENSEPDGSGVETHVVDAAHVTTTDRDFTDVSVGSPGHSDTISSTSNHPYYDLTAQVWRDAGDLHAGDKLQTPTGTTTVLAVRSYTRPQVTYDLTIDGLHTYYVLAGNTPVLVHNTGPGCGLLEGERDYDVYHPTTGNRITDIDHVGGGVLWEEKSALYGDDAWISKQIDGKLKKYIEARQYMPGYENAPIGFRLTNPSIDPRFRSALESHIDNLRQANPGVDIRLEFAQ